MQVTNTTSQRRTGPAIEDKERPAPPRSALAYTLSDAARMTGLSRSTLYRHAGAARLKLVKVGGRTLVDAASLRALVGADA
jgi:excisionase family DNA binding protein